MIQSQDETAEGIRLSAEQGEVISRLRRVEGQIRGLQRMVERGEPCEAIITQLMAARAALDKVGIHILTHYATECIQDLSPTESDKERLERALALFLKLA